jgi:hypothetical protein
MDVGFSFISFPVTEADSQSDCVVLTESNRHRQQPSLSFFLLRAHGSFDNRSSERKEAIYSCRGMKFNANGGVD